jgi:transposase-like protein
MASTTGQVLPDAKLERRTRRKFTDDEKVALLDEFGALERGEKGPWLRRKGLYAGQLSGWRKTLNRKGREGLAPAKPGRKPKDPNVARLEALERENDQLRKRLDVAEGLVSLQKKLHALLETDENEPSR